MNSQWTHSAADVPCWVCGSDDLALVKRSNATGQASSADVAITDSRYGVTWDIFRCADCGFMQCSHHPDVLSLYERLEDPSYEAGRVQRSLQQNKLLELLGGRGDGRRLLDIGAGSGMLVEKALQKGYRAEGVEPSEWLQRTAQEHGLPVYQGTFPHPATPGPYDIVTLVDVIEHVSEPVALLKRIREVLVPEGVLLVVTPDIGSVAARLLGWKWWHYRLAHIGYFNHQTLLLAMRTANLDVVRLGRPAWYFRGDYIMERTHKYLPDFLHFTPPQWSKGITLPLNTMDSIMAVCKRPPSDHEAAK